MSYRADKLVIDTHTWTHRPTDAGDDNTRRPKLALGKNKLQDQWGCYVSTILIPTKAIRSPWSFSSLIYGPRINNYHRLLRLGNDFAPIYDQAITSTIGAWCLLGLQGMIFTEISMIVKYLFQKTHMEMFSCINSWPCLLRGRGYCGWIC